MAMETIIGLIALALSIGGYIISRFIVAINWPMIYFIMRGGMKNDH